MYIISSYTFNVVRLSYSQTSYERTNVPIPVPVPYFSFTGSRGSKWGDLGPNGKEAIRFWTQNKTVTARWSAHNSTVNTTIAQH